MGDKLKMPTLKFKEFNREWEEKKYGEIYTFYSTNSLSRDKLNYDDGIVKNIHYGDIHTKFSTMFNIKNEKVPFINSDIDLSKIKEENYCLEGDLVIADASEDYDDIGKTIEIINLNNEKIIAGLHTFLARPNKYDMALGYGGYLLQSWKVRKQVMIIAQGTKVLSLSTTRLSKIKLNLPQKLEQEKIASFLSSIDKKIEQLSKKDELLHSYKKGTMQKIFSQEIRFSPKGTSSQAQGKNDGSDYPDWEEKKLKEIGNIITGSTPSTTVREYYDGNKLFVSPVDIQKNRYINSTKTCLTDLGFSKGRIIEKNSVCFVCIGSTIGKVAQVREDAITNQQINTIVSNKNNSNDFIYSLLFYNSGRIKLLAGEQAVPQINKTDFSNLKFRFPCLEEQTKIANFLSSIDTKISQNTKALEETKKFKKALLQQMFV